MCQSNSCIYLVDPVDEIYTVSNVFGVERDPHYTVNVTYIIEEKYTFNDLLTNFSEHKNVYSR